MLCGVVWSILQGRVVLKARVALVDTQKVALGLTVFILISERAHGRDWADQFSKVIASLPQFQSVYSTSGNQDYMIKAHVCDVQAYDSLYQRLISRIDLADVSARFAMKELKYITELPLL